MSRLAPQRRDELKTDEEREFYDYCDGWTRKFYDESKTPTEPSVLSPQSPYIITPFPTKRVQPRTPPPTLLTPPSSKPNTPPSPLQATTFLAPPSPTATSPNSPSQTTPTSANKPTTPISSDTISNYLPDLDPSSSTIRDSSGAFLGPIAPLQHTPKQGRLFLDLVASLGELPGLPLKAREVAVLVVGTKYQAAYELYAHRRTGVKKAGLTQDEADAICLDEKPKTLDKESSVAYDVAKELTDCPGPLSDSTWNDGCHVLGQEGMTALIHFVGGYAYASILLNGFDCKIPDGESL